MEGSNHMAVNVISGTIKANAWLSVPKEISEDYYKEFFNSKHISFEELQSCAKNNLLVPPYCLKDEFLDEMYEKMINGDIENGVLETENYGLEYACEYVVHRVDDNGEKNEMPIEAFWGSYTLTDFVLPLLESKNGQFSTSFDNEEFEFNLNDVDVVMENCVEIDNGDCVVGDISFGLNSFAGIFDDTVSFIYDRVSGIIDFEDKYSYTDRSFDGNCLDELENFVRKELSLERDCPVYDEEER